MSSYGSKVLGKQKPSGKGTDIINFEKGWPGAHRDVEDGGTGVWVAWYW